MIQSPSIQPYRDAVDISSLRWPGSRPCACPVVQANSGKFHSKPLRLTYRKEMKSVRQEAHETKARDGAWTVRKARKDVSGGLPGGINQRPKSFACRAIPRVSKAVKSLGASTWRIGELEGLEARFRSFRAGSRAFTFETENLPEKAKHPYKGAQMG